MQEARASWNTIYLTKDGFECQITLRDEDEKELLKRAERMLSQIQGQGGLPLRRKGSLHRDKERNPNPKDYNKDRIPRCTRRLKDGRICGAPLIQRQGRYGKYWFCPNYRQHADSGGARRKGSSGGHRRRGG